MIAARIGVRLKSEIISVPRAHGMSVAKRLRILTDSSHCGSTRADIPLKSSVRMPSPKPASSARNVKASFFGVDF